MPFAHICDNCRKTATAREEKNLWIRASCWTKESLDARADYLELVFCSDDCIANYYTAKALLK